MLAVPPVHRERVEPPGTSPKAPLSREAGPVGEYMLELLYQALSNDRGLVVQAEDCDIEELRQRLYRERKKAQDPDLEKLAMVPSPTDPTQLWIVRKDAM